VRIGAGGKADAAVPGAAAPLLAELVGKLERLS
jgi:hypothetical protein